MVSSGDMRENAYRMRIYGNTNTAVNHVLDVLLGVVDWIRRKDLRFSQVHLKCLLFSTMDRRFGLWTIPTPWIVHFVRPRVVLVILVSWLEATLLHFNLRYSFLASVAMKLLLCNCCHVTAIVAMTTCTVFHDTGSWLNNRMGTSVDNARAHEMVSILFC